MKHTEPKALKGRDISVNKDRYAAEVSPFQGSNIVLVASPRALRCYNIWPVGATFQRSGFWELFADTSTALKFAVRQAPFDRLRANMLMDDLVKKYERRGITFDRLNINTPAR